MYQHNDTRIMFQSFIRHARVMNNFFVTSTDHLSLLYYQAALSPFVALRLRCSDPLRGQLLDHNHDTYFYLHNFHQTTAHNIMCINMYCTYTLQVMNYDILYPFITYYTIFVHYNNTSRYIIIRSGIAIRFMPHSIGRISFLFQILSALRFHNYVFLLCMYTRF